LINTLQFTDFFNDSTRILIIASALKEYKGFKLTEQKIVLCDYYLKFPITMFGLNLDDSAFKANIDEYYAFYHWHPEIASYRRCLSYLAAKGLLSKLFLNNQITYEINELGLEALGKIQNGFKERLLRLSSLMVKEVRKLSSDSKIEEEILKKSNILSRRLGDAP